MTPLKVRTTSMGFRVNVNRSGVLKGTQISIMDYIVKFEHWDIGDQDGEKLINEYFFFDKKNEVVYFPRYDLDNFVAYVQQYGATVEIEEIPAVEGKPAIFYMLPHVKYKNEFQKNCVSWLTSAASGPIRGVALQTGLGKTVSTIWGLCTLAKRSMVTMTSRLEQWAEELKDYTTLDEDDIYIVKGVASLTKLFDQIDKKIKPKIILASARTMRLYADYGPGYQHLPPMSEMCEHLGIGAIATDEYHEHFYTNFLIGILTNPKILIPITATFCATDPFVKSIFDQFIPEAVQFSGGEYQKFVDIFAYRYEGGGSILRPRDYMGAKGYSQIIFEKFLLSKRGKPLLDTLVRRCIIPIIRDHYQDLAETGERLLVLCSLTEMCEYLAKEIKKAFSSKTVSVFVSGMPVNILKEFDVIVSTPGSAGTGRDVKGLITCFTLISTQSEIKNKQFLGRLRPPLTGRTLRQFVYLYFSCIAKHVKYANIRAFLYEQLGKSFVQRNIS